MNRNILSIFLLPAAVLAALMFVGTCFAVGESHLDTGKLPNGCSSCHRPHGWPGTVMLLEDKTALCYVCHGSVASGVPGDSSIDVETPMSKISRHEVLNSANPHRFEEVLPETLPSYDRHVTCEDCHNMHRSTPSDPVGWVKGWSNAMLVTRPAAFEYEVCYKCHSDSANLPANQRNKRAQFAQTNASYHPVEATGTNTNVPSLIPPLTFSSIIKCTDCHGNDNTSGASGPHGSNIPPILRYNYSTLDNQMESFSDYQLCYICHERDNGANGILNDASFKRHNIHLTGLSPTTCKSCHDVHGTPTYTKLIEFDTNVVLGPGGAGIPTFFNDISGSGRPRCLLNCHSMEHDTALFDGLGWP